MTVVGDNTHVNGSGQGSHHKGLEAEYEDIPIAIIGKNQEYGKAAFEALSPKYKTILVGSTVSEFLEKLANAETTPRAVFIGPIYPKEEQDELEQGIDKLGIACKVIRTQPFDEKLGKRIEQETKDMQELEKVGYVTRLMFDQANIE